MALIDNINILTEKSPDVWAFIKKLEKDNSGAAKFHVEPSKSEYPTLVMEDADKLLYIHSKYDPKAEAEKLLLQYSECERYRHVFFYGVGLGYHIEAFLKRYPMPFSIFEPCPEILNVYLSTRKMTELPLHLLEHLGTEISPQSTLRFMENYTESLVGEVLFIALPSYERIFHQHYTDFVKKFTNIVAWKRNSMIVENAYQKKWTLNSMRNLELILDTPGIIDAAGEVLQGKPAIIAAAGPSITADLENLRTIKEKGLAYIFAAGSGLHPLLNHGIMPDAACSYDPNDNCCVFQPVMERGLTEIPLIFGSTVGFSQMSRYPGAKFHFILNQDMVAPYYLKRANGELPDVFYDSPTITVVLLQLLYKLGCNPIVFAGQNLAYQGKLRYSPGIDYYNPVADDTQLHEAILTEDVNGNAIYTNSGWAAMKTNLELFVKAYQDREIINTTQNGAKIAGAPFQPLCTLIRERLRDRVVVASWTQQSCPPYDVAWLKHQHQTMEREKTELDKIIKGMKSFLSEMGSLKSGKNPANLETVMNKFNKAYKSMAKNRFYRIFLMPMQRVETDLLVKSIREFEFETRLTLKAERISGAFMRFIGCCERDLEQLQPYYTKLRETILAKVEAGETRCIPHV